MKNETSFSVGIQQGFYGGIDVVTLAPYEEKTIDVKTSLKENEELIFYYYFDILYDSLYIDSLKSNQQFFSVKPFEKQHFETISLPQKIDFNSVGIVINNLSANSLSLIRGNSFIQLNDNKKDIGITMPACSKAAFIKQSKELQSKIQIYNTNILFPDIHYLDGYIYTFSFDGSKVELEDARPLVKIGEQSWTVNLNEKSSVRKIITSKNTDNFFCINNFIGENENGALFGMASLNGLKADGSKKWNVRLNAKNGDLYLYDMCMSGENIFVIGQESNQNGDSAFSALYSADGVQLDRKEFDVANDFSSISKLAENSFLLVGFNENLVLVNAVIKENKIHYEQMALHSEKLDSEIYQIIPFYDESEKSTFLFCNRRNEEDCTISSLAYQLSADGNLNKIPLNDKIQSVSSVCKIGNSILLGGETVSQTNSSAIVLKLNPAAKTPQILYQDENPYSYIAKMNFNPKTDELVVSGTINAKTSSGTGGRPFILALDGESGKKIWKNVYSGEESNLILDFVPCADYGFVELFCDVTDDSITSRKFIRANATGKYK